MFGNEEKIDKKIQAVTSNLFNEIDQIKSELLLQKTSVENISKNAPDHFKELKASARDASHYRNRAEDQFNFVDASAAEIKSTQEKMEEVLSKFEILYQNIREKSEQTKTTCEKISVYENSINSSKEEIEESITILNELVEQKEVLEKNVVSINNFFEETEDTSNKIKLLMSAYLKDRNRIKELHQEIFGYKRENEDGESEFIEGLSSELEDSYDSIKNKVEILSDNLSTAESELATNIEQSKIHADETFKNYIEKCKTEQNDVVKKIRSFLPDALTAGLAGAYEEKINREEKQLSKHDRSFNIAIGLLIFCSLIPISSSIYQLINSIPLTEILKNIPTIISMMVPLYMPILWLAYSSNKKYKLSKRLIEEYTHKGVLSKTFEGLSKQVQDVDEDDISQELRNKLLYNLIDVNSENPGKLISDYNKSDHPLMDALDKSSQLADALSKVDRIPVLSSLVKHLADKQTKAAQVKSDKAEDILEKEIDEKKEN